MEYLSTKQVAERWQLSAGYIKNLCAAGKIAGAQKVGKTWVIPADAQKPTQEKATE